MSDLLIHVARKAMACEFEVQFPDGRYGNGTETAIEALDCIAVLEEKLSYFRPASDISRINLLAAEGPIPVEPALFDLIRSAISISEETEGAYDITSAPLWEVWGFARRKGEIPSDAQLAEARDLVGSRLLELDDATHTIRFKKPGVRINLGSIGKGYAIDVCAQHIREAQLSDFLIHGGQSSVWANGRRMPSVPWEVGIQDPQRPGRRLGVVRLQDRALGTSGRQFQSFRHQGHRYSHILDPRTGMPAEGLVSVTVLAPTAALADALSTAFFVLGPEKTLDYCRRHPEIGILMVVKNSQTGVQELLTGGLDSKDFQLGIA